MNNIDLIEAIFIYKNFDKIKCLNYNDAKVNHDYLIKNCWKHIATINPCSFLEYLYNEISDEEIISQIRNI